MDLNELLGKLPEEVKGDVSEYINTAVTAEKERGIAETGKRNTENQKLKGYLKDLGYNSENYDTISSFVEDKKTKIAEKDVTLASLNEKLTDLTSQLETERAEKTAKAKEAYDAKLKSELSDKFGKTFYAQKDIIDNLVAQERVSLDDSGNIKFGDKGFDEGFKTLKEEKADSVRVDQEPGTNETGGETPKQTQRSFAEDVKAATGNYGL